MTVDLLLYKLIVSVIYPKVVVDVPENHNTFATWVAFKLWMENLDL